MTVTVCVPFSRSLHPLLDAHDISYIVTRLLIPTSQS